MIFQANWIAVQEQDGCALVGFADEEYETQQYVMLQRSLDCSARDSALGVDSIHMEGNDQSKSVYGGLLSCELRRDRTILQLTEDAAKQLGEGLFEIAFHIEETKFEELRAGLEKVLGDAVALVVLEG